MKVKIWTDHETMETKIIFYEEREGKRFAYNPITRKETLINEGATRNSDFIMKIPSDETTQNLFDAISESGIRSEPEYKVQGQMEAMKDHLADLRTLLKLK